MTELICPIFPECSVRSSKEKGLRDITLDKGRSKNEVKIVERLDSDYRRMVARVLAAGWHIQQLMDQGQDAKLLLAGGIKKNGKMTSIEMQRDDVRVLVEKGLVSSSATDGCMEISGCSDVSQMQNISEGLGTSEGSITLVTDCWAPTRWNLHGDAKEHNLADRTSFMSPRKIYKENEDKLTEQQKAMWKLLHQFVLPHWVCAKAFEGATLVWERCRTKSRNT